MGVLKIVQANPKVFNVDKAKNRSEKEAIRIVSNMECKGNEIQIENFEIRQSYNAVCNLFSLGFRNSAVELAQNLIHKAEWYQQYHIAQELSNKMIAHFYQWGDMASAEKYKLLYDKYTLILSCEHESQLLFGKTIYNYKHILPIDIDNVMRLLDAIKQKLTVDSLWYHYYYFQCKSLLYSGEELEQLYLEAVSYFENLYFNHTNFISVFKDALIKYYIDNEEFEKALLLIENEKNKFEEGTIRWFNNSLSYVDILLKMNNPRAKEICNIVMNHSKFQELPNDRKTEWEVANEASIKIIKNSN